MCQTRLPSMVSARRRRVTMAVPSMEPRAEVTLAREPLAIPRSLASSSGISMKKPGCSMFSSLVWWVQ